METTRLCSVEGCERPIRCKGYCEMHYARLRRTSTLEARTWHRRGICRIKDCDSPERHRGLCGKHDERRRRHGDPNVVLPKGNHRSGERHASWKGAAVGSGGMHHRIRAARGSAKHYLCVDCGAQARHWSYDHADKNEQQSDRGPYSLDIAHYRPRCTRCHNRFDH